jgi:dihydroorotate dehydrogenase (NAD+) catalytic subunit
MSVDFCGLSLAHPVINGSGTFDAIAAIGALGEGLAESFPFSAYVSKTITLEPRAGNPPPRLWETPAGMINSIGLPNRGLAAYMSEELPRLSSLRCRPPSGVGESVAVPLITNVMGSSIPDISALVSACEEPGEIAAIELNVSCPNVKTGLDIGADPEQLRAVVSAVRPLTGKPLIVKLTPNTADVAMCARAAQEGGADAVSLINTLRAMALEPSGKRPRGKWLGGGTGGLSGPAIRAVALAQVASVAASVGIPVVGMGGVQCSQHARDLMDAGASLVAVGTASFLDPAAGAHVASGLSAR